MGISILEWRSGCEDLGMGISILEWRSGCEDMGMGVLGWGWQSYACCVYLHHHTVKSSRSTRHSTTSHSGCLTTCQRPMPSWETFWRPARESRWEQIHLLFSNYTYIPNSPQNQGNENTTQLLVPNTVQLLLFHVVPYPHYPYIPLAFSPQLKEVPLLNGKSDTIVFLETEVRVR